MSDDPEGPTPPIAPPVPPIQDPPESHVPTRLPATLAGLRGDSDDVLKSWYAPLPAWARTQNPLLKWLFAVRQDEDEPKEGEPGHGTDHSKPWYQVMCLTGVDYFSTLGYQPGIAFLAAQHLSPIATLFLVAMTLFAAYPVYSCVAGRSPHGSGSISMLESLLPQWWGKIFILVLLGFAATDFIITITLSAADATAHIVENPFFPKMNDPQVPVTMVLLVLLSAVFLKGFKEAIGLAVVLTVGYLLLNFVVVAVCVAEIAGNPSLIGNWWGSAQTQSGGSWWRMAFLGMLFFPKLALGLSGFETGVAVIPLVKGKPDDTPEYPVGRIENTRKLLLTAALIMSFFLIASSLITTILIPSAEMLSEDGKARGRCLAWLAHEKLGEVFGTLYDISTITVLWFAGASAMAGLLNIVPRYLPRYGMAPNWARYTRPLVLMFTAIAAFITWHFEADVEKQGAAYATGVLVLMTSAAFAVMLTKRRNRWQLLAYGVVVAIFVYTLIDNVMERPEGIHIASFFIGATLVVSFVSRLWRSTELRVEHIKLDREAKAILQAMVKHGEIRLIASPHAEKSFAEYDRRMKKHLELGNDCPDPKKVAFLEIGVPNASDFGGTLLLKGCYVGGHRVLRGESSAVANAIAAVLLHLRDQTGIRPHVYLCWSEQHPLWQLCDYLLFGAGDIAPLTREILRQAEPAVERRPVVHVD